MTDNYITLPKIGKVKFHNSKNIKNVKTASIIKENNKWFISVTYEIQEKPLAIDITKSVAIDAGIVYHSILSDETYINSSKSLESLRKLSKPRCRFVALWPIIISVVFVPVGFLAVVAINICFKLKILFYYKIF